MGVGAKMEPSLNTEMGSKNAARSARSIAGFEVAVLEDPLGIVRQCTFVLVVHLSYLPDHSHGLV
jgi:hypothetical protein